MKKILIILGILSIISTTIIAGELSTGKEIAYDLELDPQKKVMSQWKKIFKNNKRMKRYGISSLSKEEVILLKNYLIENAKDADAEEGM